jgi:hypothetical protein
LSKRIVLPNGVGAGLLRVGKFIFLADMVNGLKGFYGFGRLVSARMDFAQLA